MTKRKLYKGRHWIARGGYHFIQKTRNFEKLLVNEIEVRLRETINNVTKELEMRDVTIKIYPDHFHVFGFLLPKIVPIIFVNAVLSRTSEMLKNEFGLENVWNKEYVFTGIGSLDEDTVANRLKSMGLA